MADLSKIKLNGTVYNFKDETARTAIENISTIPLATENSDGLMSAEDKLILNNMNPNMTVTLSNIYQSEAHVINAKMEDMLDLEIIEQPHISEQIRTINLLDTSVNTPGFYIGSNGALNTNANDNVGDFIPVSPGDDIYYTGIIGPTNSSSINRRLHVYDSNYTWIKQMSFAGSLHVNDHWSTHGTVPSNGAYVRVSWGVEDTNVMITVGAPAKYYPYYITPFTAITSASFQVSPDDTYEDADEYIVTVPAAAGDVYGFKYNPILGKLYVTSGHIASYNGETLPSGWISDRDVYAEGITPSTGAEVVYQLDNEDIEEYDITPIDIPMFYRINYIKTDNGIIINFTYYAETFAVSHLSIQNGATFGETEFFESDIQEWQHAADLIDTKADIDSPNFIGSPTAPTCSAGTNSTKLATTAFVQSKLNSTIAPVEGTKASNNHQVGDYIIVSGQLYKVTSAITSGATITAGTNVEATDVATELNLLRSLITS